MKKYTLILIIIFLSCNGREIKEVNCQFFPPFITPVSYRIDLKNEILHQNSFEYVYLGSRIGTDQLINKSYKIHSNDLSVFIQEVKSVELDSSINHTRQMLDGIGLKFNIINSQKDTTRLITVSPRRNDDFRQDYKLLDALFKLVNSTITDYEGMELTEYIQDHFNYGLPIKKISSEPLEYRVWGSVGCQEDNLELISFLEKLPNEPIIFDLRNGQFADCLSDVLNEFESSRKIYYYGFHELTRVLFELKNLELELSNAEKYNHKDVGRLRVSIRENKKTQKKILNYLENNKSIHLKREDVIKTIANNMYN